MHVTGAFRNRKQLNLYNIPLTVSQLIIEINLATNALNAAMKYDNMFDLVSDDSRCDFTVAKVRKVLCLLLLCLILSDLAASFHYLSTFMYIYHDISAVEFTFTQ